MVAIVDAKVVVAAVAEAAVVAALEANVRAASRAERSRHLHGCRADRLPPTALQLCQHALDRLINID